MNIKSMQMMIPSHAILSAGVNVALTPPGEGLRPCFRDTVEADVQYTLLVGTLHSGHLLANTHLLTAILTEKFTATSVFK
jgi:hypothetical protein